MAAYAALVSLMTIIDRIQNHPCPPISLDDKQVQPLIGKITFLQDFLEVYSEEAEGLESLIADAAYAAEDMIESHVVHQILGASSSHGEEIGANYGLYDGLQKVILDMDSITKEAEEIKGKAGNIQDHLLRNSIAAAGLGSLPSSTGQMNAMVGFDDVLIDILNKLTRSQSDGQIIPIVGMGGIGKTTLARNIYENPLIVEYFDILVWVTISKEYDVQEIILEVLHQLEITEISSEMSEDILGEKLYKSLSGRRYLIIMDDMWSIEPWNEVNRFLPNNNNESRMIITTRLSNLAFQLTNSGGIEMKFLDEDQSWNLLCKYVFGEEANCPPELEEIGKKIAKNCKGLPLSIVVIGGLLAKSEQAHEFWEYVAKNLSSMVNLEDDELCLKILYTSYNQLPVFLKPCFLYMGVFPEDAEIRASLQVKLWAAEGFLKPVASKSLEEVGEEYLKELIERNLILVHERGSTGDIKLCKMHDLLRDLCVREAEKHKFLIVTSQNAPNIPRCMNTARRIAFQKSTSSQSSSMMDVPVPHQAVMRSLLICGSDGDISSLNFGLLRVLNAVADKKSKFSSQTYKNMYSLDDVFQLVNLRFLAPAINSGPFQEFPSSVYRLWNLQTIICETVRATAPPEIWKMHLLRHVQFDLLSLPDPPPSSHEMDNVVLENLQTLSKILDFRWSEEIVKRIPNIKKLNIVYSNSFWGGSAGLNNLAHLHKLQSVRYEFWLERNDVVQDLIFPHSLKKLDFLGGQLHWKDVAAKIGSLPCLEKLKLTDITGSEWEPVEGQFLHLKFLSITMCRHLKYWMADGNPFPVLERLVLNGLPNLEVIPPAIGENLRLRSIGVYACSKSVIISAKTMVEEQEELGNSHLQVHGMHIIQNELERKEMENLASQNFRLKLYNQEDFRVPLEQEPEDEDLRGLSGQAEFFLFQY